MSRATLRRFKPWALDSRAAEGAKMDRFAGLAMNAFEKGEVMPSRTALASVCVAATLLGLVVAGCGKGYRQIVVVEGDKADFFTFGPPPKEPQQVYTPGRVLV